MRRTNKRRPRALAAVAAAMGCVAGLQPGGWVMASDERGIDETVRPRLLPESCSGPLVPVGTEAPGSSGVVMVRVLVDVEGQVMRAEIERSGGSPKLDTDSLEAAARCRFQPATQNQVPVAEWAFLQYQWTLPGEP